MLLLGMFWIGGFWVMWPNLGVYRTIGFWGCLLMLLFGMFWIRGVWDDVGQLQRIPYNWPLGLLPDVLVRHVLDEGSLG